jgi:SpoIID/LytB domain protein
LTRVAHAALVVLLVLLGLSSSSDRVAAHLLTTQPRTAPAQAAAPIGTDLVRIGVLRNGRYEVVSLPVEVYVARVLAGEAAPESPPASLEALAIAIRTYTATNRGRHGADGFDLCDQTHCQVMRNSTIATERAALATAEQILLYRGSPATVFYSASCGGRSEKPSNVWPGADNPPYLSIHDDDGCGGFPSWSAELAEADLQRAFVAGGFRGTLRDIRIQSRNESGRVATLALDGLTPREISGQDLRMVVGRSLGFQHIQSTQFELRRAGRAFRFTGHGAGHGVGLCVIGSMKLAANGQSATTILARYFPGAQTGPYGARLTAAPKETAPAGAPPPRDARTVAPPPILPPVVAPSSKPAMPAIAPPAADLPPRTDVVVVVPPGAAGERSALIALVGQERDALARTLELDPPAVRLRFHESNEAYERATGQPWFTLSAVGHDGIELAPLSLLRERGMLERVLRRQLVHVMVDPILPARPAWIREGAAAHFADPGSTQATGRPACPQDSALQRPPSIGALGEALAGARACFERQISAGRDWRRVR